MSRKKITTAKKETIVSKNKQRLDNLLNDTELSDVTLDFAYNRFMLHQYEGIGNLILGYAQKPAGTPAPRKADYVYTV